MGRCLSLTRVAAAALSAVLVASVARAQDVNGVPNADVAPGYRSVALRLGYSAPSDGRRSSFAEFIQYQHNLSDRWSLSGGLLFGARGDDAHAFKAAQTSVQMQFAERKRDGGDGAVIVIARIPDGNEGPGRVAALLAGKWVWREDWEIRAAAATSVEYGVGARSGVGLGFRGEATRRIGAIGRLGVQMVDGFNTTTKIGPFRTQSHQAGVTFKRPFGPSLLVTAAGLFGFTEAAPDAEFRLFLTYEL